MLRNSIILLGLVLCCILLATPAFALREVKSASYPAISADGKTVYFTCWGDVWCAPRDGALPARRLTDNVAYDGRPVPAPDGASLLFLSDRFGNYDLFTMPAAGGTAQRITFDSNTDYPYDWTSDGKAVLEYTVRQDLWGNAIYETPLDGTKSTRLTGPDQKDDVFGSYLGGTDEIVFARGAGDWTRKNYSGSSTYDLWSYNRQSKIYTQLTDTPFNEMWPQPSPDGAKVYFASDRDGTSNLWLREMRTQQESQLTHLVHDGVRWPRISSDGDDIVYEVAGELYVLSTSGGQPVKLNITFDGDYKHEMLTDREMGNGLSEYAVAPNGRYFATVVLGDICILKNPDSYPPDAKPDQDLSRTHQVVQSTGREMQPSWSPDSMRLAYISDREGQFDVYVYDMTTQQEQRLTSTEQDEWYPSWSPAATREAEQQYLLYYSGNRKLMLYDIKAGQESLLHEGQIRNGPWALGYDWAPDGNWVGYTEDNPVDGADVYIINLEDRKPINVSFTPDWDAGLIWSKDGKWLAYGHYGEGGGKVMLLELNPRQETYDTDLLFPEDKPKAEPKPEEAKPAEAPPAPAVPATTEAPPAPAESQPAPEAPKADAAKPEEKKDEKPKGPEPIVIDLDRIHLRARAINNMPGNADPVAFDPNGKFILFQANYSGNPEVWWMTLKDRAYGKLADAAGKDSPQFIADGSKLYFLQGGGINFIALNGTNITGGGGYGATSRIVFDQFAIWEQMMLEGWRHLRDSFYDKAMRGVDWDAVLARYQSRIGECGSPEEFSQLMRDMLGELGGSHLGYYSGANTREAPADTTADFGVLYDEAYSGPGWRVARVVTHSPADQPGSRLFVGDVILKLNDAEISSTHDPARLMRNLAGQVVTLRVKHDEEVCAVPLNGKSVKAPDAPPAGERTVLIKPVPEGSLGQLRYEQWVEDNRKYVYQMSSSQIGYQHIQGMNGPSLEKFQRELFSESMGKRALIIDVRFNGGGGIHEQLVDILDRRPFGYSGPRDAPRAPQPALRWEGPIVVLINPNSYSDAEIFPHLMKQLGLGTIMGEPTGGNVIGTYDFQLLDGSGFRLPAMGWWLLDNTDMEGNGTQPDVFVAFDPAAGAAGRDNQLEQAVQYLKAKVE